jgi:hypothetical protein
LSKNLKLTSVKINTKKIKMKTIITDILKITPNNSKKTFTIRKYDKDYKKIIKYRSFPVNDNEFEEMEAYTERDWKNWLNVQPNNYESIKYY